VQGWAKSDAGQYLGESGKPVIGWLSAEMASITTTSPLTASWYPANGWSLMASGTTSTQTVFLLETLKLMVLGSMKMA